MVNNNLTITTDPFTLYPCRLSGFEAVGTVIRNGIPFMLVKNTDTGIYAQYDGTGVRSVSQIKAKAAMGEWSNSKKMDRGSKKSIYLSEDQWELIKKLGNGEYSQGVREALRRLQENERS